MVMKRALGDNTGCPYCYDANKAVGGGVDYGDASFNFRGGAWSICIVHRVRWYVTREMIGLPDGGPRFVQLLEVEPVLNARP